jgi:uncharacterized membrane protein YfcA
LEKILAILAGLIVGFLVGMTGMGGGALMTPFLILVMRMNPVMAVGTDLMFAAITKIGGGIQHRRQRTVWLKPVFYLALGSIPASFLGAQLILTNLEDERFLREILPLILGVVLFIVGLIVLARAFGWIKSRHEGETRWPYPWMFILVGALGGLLVGLTSIGGGTVIMALLLIFSLIPPEQLVGLDVTHGAILALFTASNYALVGQVDWLLIGWLLLGSVPGVWLGARAVRIVPQRAVRIFLGSLLLIAGGNIIIK